MRKYVINYLKSEWFSIIALIGIVIAVIRDIGLLSMGTALVVMIVLTLLTLGYKKSKNYQRKIERGHLKKKAVIKETGHWRAFLLESWPDFVFYIGLSWYYGYHYVQSLMGLLLLIIILLLLLVSEYRKYQQMDLYE